MHFEENFPKMIIPWSGTIVARFKFYDSKCHKNAYVRYICTLPKFRKTICKKKEKKKKSDCVTKAPKCKRCTIAPPRNKGYNFTTIWILSRSICTFIQMLIMYSFDEIHTMHFKYLQTVRIRSSFSVWMHSRLMTRNNSIADKIDCIFQQNTHTHISFRILLQIKSDI